MDQIGITTRQPITSTWDLNPDYTYNAKDTDPPVMKRKVSRGGSWKDVAYFLRSPPVLMNTRIPPNAISVSVAYRPYLGRQKDDNPATGFPCL